MSDLAALEARVSKLERDMVTTASFTEGSTALKYVDPAEYKRQSDAGDRFLFWLMVSLVAMLAAGAAIAELLMRLGVLSL